jgi:hypothetical protein
VRRKQIVPKSRDYSHNIYVSRCRRSLSVEEYSLAIVCFVALILTDSDRTARLIQGDRGLYRIDLAYPRSRSANPPVPPRCPLSSLAMPSRSLPPHHSPLARVSPPLPPAHLHPYCLSPMSRPRPDSLRRSWVSSAPTPRGKRRGSRCGSKGDQSGLVGTFAIADFADLIDEIAR